MHCQRILPSSVTLLSLLFGDSKVVHVRCLHSCAILDGIMSDIDMSLSNSVMNVHGRCGSIEDSRKFFVTWVKGTSMMRVKKLNREAAMVLGQSCWGRWVKEEKNG